MKAAGQADMLKEQVRRFKIKKSADLGFKTQTKAIRFPKRTPRKSSDSKEKKKIKLKDNEFANF